MSAVHVPGVDLDTLARWMDSRALGDGACSELELIAGGTQNVGTTELFTVSSTLADTAAATNAIALGPLSFVAPGADEVVATRTQVSTLIANPFANMALSTHVRAKNLLADASSLMVAGDTATRLEIELSNLVGKPPSSRVVVVLSRSSGRPAASGCGLT